MKMSVRLKLNKWNSFELEIILKKKPDAFAYLLVEGCVRLLLLNRSLVSTINMRHQPNLNQVNPLSQMSQSDKLNNQDIRHFYYQVLDLYFFFLSLLTSYLLINKHTHTHKIK